MLAQLWNGKLVTALVKKRFRNRYLFTQFEIPLPLGLGPASCENDPMLAALPAGKTQL